MASQARVKELDATRGLAILAVCVSHASGLIQQQWRGVPSTWMVVIGMIATPTFLLLSGAICGLLTEAGSTTPTKYRWRLIDRGLFLLIVAHAVLGVIHSTWMGFDRAMWQSFYITDAVAVGLIFAGLVADRFLPRTLITLGAVLLLLGWAIANVFRPHDALTLNLLRLLVGTVYETNREDGYIVPLIPYLGVFLIGLAGGKKFFAKQAFEAGTADLARVLIRIGLASTLAAIGLKLVWLLIKPNVADLWQIPLYRLTEPRQKLPPGVCYVLAYGGAGTMLAGLLYKISPTRIGRRLIAIASTFGRASLVIFIAGSAIYTYPARGLHIDNLGLSFFMLFPASLMLLWTLSWAWDRKKYNRLFTLGLRRLGGSGPRAL